MGIKELEGIGKLVIEILKIIAPIVAGFISQKMQRKKVIKRKNKIIKQ